MIELLSMVSFGCQSKSILSRTAQIVAALTTNPHYQDKVAK